MPKPHLFLQLHNLDLIRQVNHWSPVVLFRISGSTMTSSKAAMDIFDDHVEC